MKFDGIVILGDSWSYGSELNNLSDRFEYEVSKHFNLSSLNLAREAATNHCYKWHWIDYLQKPQFKHPLVIVGLTNPSRFLLFDNESKFFQECPDRLVSEELVHANWGNSQEVGGFFRAYPNIIDKILTPKKVLLQKQFYADNHNSTMAEIYSFWEITLLDRLIKDSNGHPIFWSNFYNYKQANLPWTAPLLKNINTVNNLQPFDGFDESYSGTYFKGCECHPNATGHQAIASKLIEQINGILG